MLTKLQEMWWPSFDKHQCKAALKQAVIRMTLHKRKREEQIELEKRNIQGLVRDGKDEQARIRVEYVLKDQETVQAMEILTLFAEKLQARMDLVAMSSECPEDLREAVSSIIYASPLVNIDELITARAQFALRFGREFVEEAMCDKHSRVNRALKDRLAIKQPDAWLVNKMLADIVPGHECAYVEPCNPSLGQAPYFPPGPPAPGGYGGGPPTFPGGSTGGGMPGGVPMSGPPPPGAGPWYPPAPAYPGPGGGVNPANFDPYNSQQAYLNGQLLPPAAPASGYPPPAAPASGYPPPAAASAGMTPRPPSTPYPGPGAAAGFTAASASAGGDAPAPGAPTGGSMPPASGVNGGSSHADAVDNLTFPEVPTGGAGGRIAGPATDVPDLDDIQARFEALKRKTQQ